MSRKYKKKKKNKAKGNISQEFILRNIDEIRNRFVEEIEQNGLMSNKHKKDCTPLNYIEHFLILAVLSVQ